jgi:hypothetical protein
MDDDVGDLKLFTADAGRATKIGEGVQLSTAALAYSSESVFFVQDYDTQTGAGELCMRVVRNGDTFCEPGVLAHHALFRPGRGVAYVKQVAGGARLFWARVE